MLFAWNRSLETNRKRIIVGLLALHSFSLALHAFADEENPSADQPIDWEEASSDTFERAFHSGKPIILRAGASWCGWCRKLDDGIRKKIVQDELTQWHLVYLDVDKRPDLAREFGIGPIPALRIFTSKRQPVDSRDGFLRAEELAAWLRQKHVLAEGSFLEALGNVGKPSVLELVTIVGLLEERDPTIREAAIRRILPYPKIAAGLVVQAFLKGRLASQLSAIELLAAWKAPMAGLDPWNPGTIARERSDALKRWASEVGADYEAEFSNSEREAAREAMRRLAHVEDLAQSEAIREQLARHGKSLLPELYKLLEHANDPQERERLLALRYRLVASHATALSWPSGFTRLASQDARTCRTAARELAQRATTDDTDLLLELFSHSDPLVKEISLGALRAVGGQASTDAMARLLRDPEPNVRAAVLKELADDPSSKILDHVIAFVADESDSDLIVHAVRVLRSIKDPKSIDALRELTTHSSWNVRAETAEALGEQVSCAYGSASASIADAYVALIELLDDEDGFVVSRAVAGLESVNLPIAVEPLVKAVRKHPEFAAEALSLLGSNRALKTKAIPYIREFCTHENPQVRASALSALAEAAPDRVKDELLQGIRDESKKVRVAAASVLLEFLAKRRPTEYWARLVLNKFEKWLVDGARHVGLPLLQPLGDVGEEDWLVRFRQGSGRPLWLGEIVAPMKALARSQDVEERIFAAVILSAFGEDNVALPVLMNEARQSPKHGSRIAQALPWLLWPERRQLFLACIESGGSTDQQSQIIGSMTALPDKRAAPLLWHLLQSNQPGIMDAVYSSLTTIYFRNSFIYDLDEIGRMPQARIKIAARDARVMARTGSPHQKLVALILLVISSEEDIGPLAEAMYRESQFDDKLRSDALRLHLISLKEKERGQISLDALHSADKALQRVALAYLAKGAQTLARMQTAPIWLTFVERSFFSSRFGSRAQAPKPRAELDSSLLSPFLADPDDTTSSYAAYLLAQIKDPRGLDTLIARWQKQRTSEESRELVYEAISFLNSEDHVHILEDIYATFTADRWRVSPFYWTIRSMTGDRVLRLRKKIRDDVGMDQLR